MKHEHPENPKTYCAENWVFSHSCKLSFLLLLFCSCCKVGVTQVRGGFVSYRYNGLNDYTLIIEKHRDTTTWTNSGGVYFHDTLGFPVLYDIDGLYMMDVDTCLVYANDSCLIPQLHPWIRTNEAPEILTALDTAYNSCKISIDSVGFRRYLLERNFKFNIPESGLYLLYQFNQLNNIYKNLPMDELIWYTQYTYIPPPSRIEINSAPVLSSPAIMYLCLNEINSRTLEFFDAENDSLSVELYHLNRVLEGVAPPYPISNSVLVTYADGYDYQNPILGSPGFNIDPSTFEITSLPSEEGTYLVGLKVNEWRNGELINFIMYNMTVFVRSCGNIEANFSVPECSGLELEIENLSLYSTDFMWDFGIPNSPADTSSQQIPIASFPEAGEYEVTLIAQPGSCADTLIQPVVVSPPIDVSFSLDDPECANGQWLVEFVPDGIIAENTEISWSFANGTPENSQAFEPTSVLFDPNQTVISSISADNGYCNSIYEFEFVLPNYPSVEIIDLIDPCPGYEISFDALTSGADSFHWDFGDLTSSLDFSFLNNPVYDYSQEGDYLVQLTINEGSSCEMTDTSLFSILANQDIELIYDVHVPELCDQSYAVNVHWLGQNDLSLQWDMGDGSILQESSFAYTYGGPGEHTISLTATNEPCPGFSAEQITIQLTEIGLDPNAPMIYPNVFTPGIDSLNKYFRPVHPQEVTSTPLDQNTDVYNLFDLQIFNRYGQQVFKSDEQIRGWDGKINGEFAPEGTYYYTFNYRLPCMDSPKSYSNQLTLIRD